MNKTTLTATILVGAFATLTALAPINTDAAEATTAVSRQVSYAGLDLDTPAGADTFYARLKSAARSLCSSHDPVDRAAPSWTYRECMEGALARVVRDSNHPLLAQMFVNDYGVAVAAQFGVDEAPHVAQK
jgi:UrcA family protein